MQLQSIVIAALAALAAAVPYGDHCKPATYECTKSHGKPGWNVCNTSGNWEFGGFCPPKTKCYFNEQNQSPYCI